MLVIFWRRREREEERGTCASFTLNPDIASVDLDDALHESQPNARSLCFNIQFIEQAEYAFMLFRGDANPIIEYIKYRFFILHPILSDITSRFWLVSHEFNRILDQVLQSLGQPNRVAVDNW
jgi:hypothetical protein